MGLPHPPPTKWVDPTPRHVCNTCHRCRAGLHEPASGGSCQWCKPCTHTNPYIPMQHSTGTPAVHASRETHVQGSTTPPPPHTHTPSGL